MFATMRTARGLHYEVVTLDVPPVSFPVDELYEGITLDPA